jgi:hypothetical protein
MIAYLRALAAPRRWRATRTTSTPDIHDIARWAVAEHERAERLAARLAALSGGAE